MADQGLPINSPSPKKKSKFENSSLAQFSESFEEDSDNENKKEIGLLQQAIDECKPNYDYKLKYQQYVDVQSSLPEISQISSVSNTVGNNTTANNNNINKGIQNYQMQCKGNKQKRHKSSSVSFSSRSPSNSGGTKSPKYEQMDQISPLSPETQKLKKARSSLPYSDTKKAIRKKQSLDIGSNYQTSFQNQKSPSSYKPISYTPNYKRNSLPYSPKTSDFYRKNTNRYHSQDFIKVKENALLSKSSGNLYMNMMKFNQSSGNMKQLETSVDQIEQQYIQYLDKAIDEYTAVKDTYLKWHATNLQQIKQYPPHKQQKIMLEIAVPDIRINLPVDELESNIKDLWHD